MKRLFVRALFLAIVSTPLAPSLTAQSPPSLSLRQALQPGKPFTIPALALNLIYVKPGSFPMGPKSGPLTQVTLTRGYWIGQTEITRSQWSQIMGGHDLLLRSEEKLPERNVSHGEAKTFCQKLTARERAAGRLLAGHVYDLPSEAQWEYAANAGGTDVVGTASNAAWDAHNSGMRPQPVATKDANRWGLHDVHGNVWEWCSDAFDESLPGGSVADPTGPRSSDLNVVRGGSWVDETRTQRMRDGLPPETRSRVVGFRIVLRPNE